MVFTEQKTDKGFIYKVEDVFGEMEFESPEKVEPVFLDQIFLAIFNIKSNTEIIEGDIKGTGIRYKFKKAKQWDKLDEEKEHPEPIKVKTNLFNNIKQWLSKLKKLLKKFIVLMTK